MELQLHLGSSATGGANEQTAGKAVNETAGNTFDPACPQSACTPAFV